MRPVSAGLLATLALLLLPSAGPAAVQSDGRFASYLGGSGTDRARAVAVDSSGGTFVVGVTSSTDFPVKNALFGSPAGGTDAFVARIAADGRTVLWATYLGGSGDDAALAVATDSAGGAWVAGTTNSSDFPTQGAMQPSVAGGDDAFLVHISADGATLLSSTLLGGSGNDRIAAVAVDPSGDAWVAGTTDSGDFPVTFDGFQGTAAGDEDGFIARVSADGSSLVHSTYAGGSGADEILGMTVEASGAVTVVGSTASDDFPTLAALGAARTGGTDGFVLRMDGSTGLVVFSTYFGGSDDDAATSVASDGNGVIVVSGTTRSLDLPVAGALQGSLAGGSDAFLLSLASDGTYIRFSTYLGGSDDDEGLAVSLAPDGTAVLAGSTLSADFPVKAAYQAASGGGRDGFLARIAKNGADLNYATYLGGSGDDSVAAMAVDGTDTVVLAGETGSSDLPVLYPFQGAGGGDVDVLVGRAYSSPVPPADFGVQSVSHLQITITWSDTSGGRAEFEIQRRPVNGAWETVAIVPPGTTSWTDTDVLPVTAYDYRVRALLDGEASAFSPELIASTLPIPLPAVPGNVTLQTESPTRILVQWNDLSDNEITFEVFRCVDGGPFALVRSLTAGSTSWEDAGVTADRTWSYRVRAVGITGPSAPSATVSVSTSSTYSLAGIQGKRVDSARTGMDSLILSASFTALEGASGLDPQTEGFQIGLGEAGSPALVSILPGDPGWKVRNGVYTWKSPKGTFSMATLVVDTVKGTIRLKITHLNLPAQAAGGIRTWMRCGVDAGSASSPWVALKKAGVLAAK